MIQATLANMAADIEAARLLVYQRGLAQGSGAARHAGDLHRQALRHRGRDARRLRGGPAARQSWLLERVSRRAHYRDIKGLQIYEGTSHIQRIIIARELIRS